MIDLSTMYVVRTKDAHHTHGLRAAPFLKRASRAQVVAWLDDYQGALHDLEIIVDAAAFASNCGLTVVQHDIVTPGPQRIEKRKQNA